LREVASVRLGLGYALGVAATMAALAALVVAQVALAGPQLLGPAEREEMEIQIFTPLLLLAYAGLIAAHEGLHVAAMRALGVRVRGVSLVKAGGVLPVALRVEYEEIDIPRYIAVCLAPQVLTVALLASCAASAGVVVEGWLFSGPVSFLLFSFYFVHLLSSAGDIYGVAYTLLKARTLRGVWVAVRSDGSEVYKLYVED